MKELTFEKMKEVKGGDTSYITGWFCGATVVLASFLLTAPLAGATGVGCLVGLYHGLSS